MREHWLNDWPRSGISVLIGTNVCCAGCGTTKGLTCIAIDENCVYPEQLPDWPFEQDTCPICEIFKWEKEQVVTELTVKDLEELSVSTLRQALIKAKIRENNEKRD